MSNNKSRDAVLDIIKQFVGQQATLVIPRFFIRLCGGDHLAALLLSQILYWTDRTKDPNGWIAKSYQEWHEELEMTEYQVRRAINGDRRSKSGGFAGLKALGVEVKLRRSKFHSGAATLHYRVDMKKIQEVVLNNVQNPRSEHCSEPEANNVQDVCTESTCTEDFKEKDIAPPNGGAKEFSNSSAKQEQKDGEVKSSPKGEVPKADFEPMVEAIVKAFDWSWERMTESEKGVVRKAAHELCLVNVKPKQISSLYNYCADTFQTFKPMALASNVSDWRLSKKRQY